MSMFGDNGWRSWADLSDDRVYRYALGRTWDDTLGQVVFIGLNPSTADETLNDPTIRRCIGFAKAWGYGSLVMLNLFALRATDPKGLRIALDPIGYPRNDQEISRYARQSALVVAAWGADEFAIQRGQVVVEQIRYQGDGYKLHHLGRTKHGQPKHPLYLAKTTDLQRW